MKKIKHFILFVSLLLLTGCSERVLSIDRVYPDTARLEEAREKKQLELEAKEQEKSLSVILKERKVVPRSLELSSEYDSTGYTANVTQFCWALIPGECERIQPIHPNDNTTPFYSLQYLKVTTGGKIHIETGISIGTIPAPKPDRVEAYIYDENKALHLHEAIDNPKKNYEFTVPSKPDSYIFLFKAYYKGEAEGISYHPQGITVVSEK